MVFFAIAIYFLRDILIILFLAVVISSAVNAPISFLERKRIPRVLGALLISLTAIAVVALLLYTIVPAAIIELNEVLKSLGDLENFEISVLGKFISPEIMKNFETNIGSISDVLLSGGTSLINLISSVFGSIASVVAVFVLSFYLAASKEGVERFLKSTLPANQENYALKIYSKTKYRLGLWFQGQLILSLVITAFVFFGLLILGVKYSLVFGLLGGILELVPFVGPVIVGILATLVGISDSWTLGIATAIFFVIMQQIENHLLVPLVMKRAVGIHPVVAVISLLAGVQLAGFVGIILAIPSAVVIQEILEDWGVRKNQIGKLDFENADNF
ncbi:hypothetical protein A2999_00445 [Candidatus Wolfebacteria bacterium RIFCSPLOWO2_01_FULL_38_11]|uniref:Permease n=2 Tax=Candidatus Wolfeibacteriota TaxID=1752735 RepID=A0A0G0IG11_9BACT|nr:MAG: hypothetical protein US36_C0004G0020 [Candidatus Wolfebacteria bacterium GW2011_GWC1_37_10]OGM91765.1 MAG: hypothetical protein A2999_00445 [Candidatus Wolfebacteria bacterium RIFCSPLOWO2_01_FULL_38_11]